MRATKPARELKSATIHQQIATVSTINDHLPENPQLHTHAVQTLLQFASLPSNISSTLEYQTRYSANPQSYARPSSNHIGEKSEFIPEDLHPKPIP